MLQTDKQYSLFYMVLGLINVGSATGNVFVGQFAWGVFNTVLAIVFLFLAGYFAGRAEK